jgi:hypothetical protein
MPLTGDRIRCLKRSVGRANRCPDDRVRRAQPMELALCDSYSANSSALSVFRDSLTDLS